MDDLQPTTPKRVMTPTPGRQVWFYGYPLDSFNLHEGKHAAFRHNSGPLPATVVHVWNERMVDLDIIDHKGIHWFTTSVHLRQPDDEQPPYHYWAEWMPYQVKVGT